MKKIKCKKCEGTIRKKTTNMVEVTFWKKVDSDCDEDGHVSSLGISEKKDFYHKVCF